MSQADKLNAFSQNKLVTGLQLRQALYNIGIALEERSKSPGLYLGEAWGDSKHLQTPKRNLSVGETTVDPPRNRFNRRPSHLLASTCHASPAGPEDPRNGPFERRSPSPRRKVSQVPSKGSKRSTKAKGAKLLSKPFRAVGKEGLDTSVHRSTSVYIPFKGSKRAGG